MVAGLSNSLPDVNPISLPLYIFLPFCTFQNNSIFETKMPMPYFVESVLSLYFTGLFPVR